MQGISVIIPTYNRQKYIAEAIQSVLNQKYDGKLEIIISDDGSTDKTLEIAKFFGNKVHILRKGKDCLSQGVSSTRNRGLKAATQPYISFLDSDDFYLPDHLSQMASVLENSPNLDFAFCRILELKEENGTRLFKKWTHQHITKNDIKNPVVSRGFVVHTNSFLFRKSVFDIVGSFNESYSNGEDSDLWMRISEVYKGIFVDNYGAAYRTNHGDTQLTSNSIENIRNCSLMIYNTAIERYYQLGLKDTYRIFALKQRVSYIKYNNMKLLHYINYIFLICMYPIAFFQRIPYLRFFRRKKTDNWHILSYFLGNLIIK